MTENVAFVTFCDQPGLTPDDARAAGAVRRITGLEVEAVTWDETTISWERFAAIVLRSMWDYFRRPGEFKHWLRERASSKIPMFNSPRLVEWNMDKTYLQQLAELGVQIVPTFWVKEGESINLAEVLAKEGWSKAVVKPTVSGAAYETWVTSVNQAEPATDQARLDRLGAGRGIMIQPFVDAIVTLGEWSVIFIDGKYSHAMLKRPAAGDFRVQAQFGALHQALSPPPALVEQSLAVLEAATRVTGEPMPLYARVDAVQTSGDSNYLLMELEVIEPVLFFAADPEHAPQRFAQALAHRLEAVAV